MPGAAEGFDGRLDLYFLLLLCDFNTLLDRFFLLLVGNDFEINDSFVLLWCSTKNNKQQKQRNRRKQKTKKTKKQRNRETKRSFPSRALAHVEIVRSLGVRELPLELVRNGDIQIPIVLLVWLAADLPLDDLLVLHGQNIINIKNRLLPMGVLGIRSSGEIDRLVTGGEGDVKIHNEGMDVIVRVDLDLEIRGEGQFGLGHSVEVEGLESTRLRNHCSGINNVNQGLSNGDFLDGGHVEAVDIVPEAQLLVLVLAVFNRADVHRGLVGEEETPRSLLNNN